MQRTALCPAPEKSNESKSNGTFVTEFSAPETVSAFHEKHHPTVVSSADGAKIQRIVRAV